MNMKFHFTSNCKKGLFSFVFLLGFIAGGIEVTTAQTEPSREPILLSFAKTQSRVILLTF
jgi:hypothetical protein